MRYSKSDNLKAIATDAKSILKGVRFGRRRIINRNAVFVLNQEGVGATEIARRLKIARSTVYKIHEEKTGL